MNCPDCGNECDRDEVDNGVGIMYGPWGCTHCGWSELDEFNLKLIEQPKDGRIDSRGGFTPF